MYLSDLICTAMLLSPVYHFTGKYPQSFPKNYNQVIMYSPVIVYQVPCVSMVTLCFCRFQCLALAGWLVYRMEYRVDSVGSGCRGMQWMSVCQQSPAVWCVWSTLLCNWCHVHTRWRLTCWMQAFVNTQVRGLSQASAHLTATKPFERVEPTL